jgi:hypothetical protein
MRPAGRTDWTGNRLDDIACDFLRSEFIAQTYSFWPIDRRVDAYLQRSKEAPAMAKRNPKQEQGTSPRDRRRGGRGGRFGSPGGRRAVGRPRVAAVADSAETGA